MRKVALIGLLVASTCWAREPVVSPQSRSQAQPQTPSASENQTITIPVGTRVPLALASPITTKARPGNAVRAVTGFPITVGTQLAIPAGTYVEGVIDKVNKRDRSGSSLLMHFTRLLYANGYSVAVDGANTQAKALRPDSAPPESSAFAGAGGPLAAPQSTTLPPLPRVGPSIGAIAGVAIGVSVAGAVGLVLLNRHSGRGSGVLFDAGWQFEMVLQSPMSVDVASVAAAAAVATHTAQ
jgi:type IV secretion system protein VirB10